MPTIFPTAARLELYWKSSNDNLIEENVISKNAIGIGLDEYSLSNHIYRNQFDNSQNVISKSATSVWSSPKPFTFTYLGNDQQNYMGNYWSDYRGKDKNADGIGDTPYGIMIGANPKAILESYQNINDEFPLMDPLPFYYNVVPATGEAISLTTNTFTDTSRNIPDDIPYYYNS